MRKSKGTYSFLNLATEVLQTSDRPLSIEEIWEKGETLGLTEKVGSTGKTPVKTLSARLYIDIRDNEKSMFVQVSKRPALFVLKGKNDLIEKVDTESFSVSINYKERDLHILLSSFVQVDAKFKCVTKTIFHEKSSNKKKGFNQWLHPDIVGCYFPFADYMNETQELQEIFGGKAFKVFSFEIKIKLDYSNLRECYFQAVSNSSWANEGYLVTLKLENDDSFLEELRRLNNAFGIGIIKLVPEHISQSEIILPAKYNEKVDWDTVDRLMTENPNFQQFANDIKEDVKLRKTKSTYDKVFLDDDEAADYAISKNIL